MSISEFPRHRARRPSHRPASGSLLKRRRRRSRKREIITADMVLHHLVAAGEVVDVGKHKWLVAPIDDRRIEQIVVALAAAEDDEPNGDMESSLGQLGEDRESDGLEDDTERGNGEASLGWANEGGQSRLTANADETEPELGWANTGPQTRLAAGYSEGTIREGDGDCDDEDGDPSGDVLDKGELDPCDMGEPNGDEGDHSGHGAHPADADIRMMLRDNIDRKRQRRGKPIAATRGTFKLEPVR